MFSGTCNHKVAFRHLLAHVLYINFLVSMSLSKINKLTWLVTIRRGHFINSLFVNPGIYSCAVDAFLEISTHLFLPYVSHLHIRNEFKDLLFNVCSHYQKRGSYSEHYF